MFRYCSVFCLILVVRLSATDDYCPPEREQKLHFEAKLRNDLLCAYKPDYRPVNDSKSTVEIQLRFTISYISFNELEETFRVQSWMALNWKDEYLTWSPTDYGGLTETQLESYEIWAPRIVVFNNDVTTFWLYKIYTTCLVKSNGSVTCVDKVTHSGICSTSLRYWPYDVQNCTLYVGTSLQISGQVNLTFYKEKPIIIEDNPAGNGWKLLTVYNERFHGKFGFNPNNTYPGLKYTYSLQRESGGLAATVVALAIVIVILTLKGMLTEIQNNTRHLFICFNLLAHFLFVLAVSLVLPKFSSDTPVVLLFIRDSMVLTLIGFLTTFLLVYLKNRKSPVPRWIFNVNNVVNSSPIKYVIFTAFDPNDATFDSSITEKAHVDWIHFTNIVNAFVLLVIYFSYFILYIGYMIIDK